MNLKFFGHTILEMRSMDVKEARKRCWSLRLSGDSSSSPEHFRVRYAEPTTYLRIMIRSRISLVSTARIYR